MADAPASRREVKKLKQEIASLGEQLTRLRYIVREVLDLKVDVARIDHRNAFMDILVAELAFYREAQDDPLVTECDMCNRYPDSGANGVKLCPICAFMEAYLHNNDLGSLHNELVTLRLADELES